MIVFPVPVRAERICVVPPVLRVKMLPLVDPMVRVPLAVPALVVKEMLVKVWLAELFVMEERIELIVAVVVGTEAGFQLPAVFQSPPEAPVHVAFCALADERAAARARTAAKKLRGTPKVVQVES